MTKQRILVVDDDAPILTLMRNLLREFGFETSLASTGPEALRLVSEVSPDLVLLDMNMPGMSGADVIRALRTQAGLDHVPVLMLTGAPVSQVEIAELGANGALQKPFDITDLIAKIRANLRGAG